MKAEIFKEDINAALQSLFWSIGIHGGDKQVLLPIMIIAQNDVMEFTVCHNGNYFKTRINATVTESGVHTVKFAWLKNICDRLLTNKIHLYDDATNLFLKTEECKAALVVDKEQIEFIPPGSSEEFVSVVPAQVNQVAMHMNCAGPITTIYFKNGTKDLWFESSSEVGNCMAKIALQETSHQDFKSSVVSEKLMYMTRGVAALNPSAGKIISSKDGLWLKSNWCLARLNAGTTLDFGASQRTWSEESKNAHNVIASRKGAINILDACVAAQPAEDVVTIDSVEHSGQHYLRFAVDGFYRLNKILHADGPMPKAVKVPVSPLIKFLKTYLDPMVRLAVTPNYLYVIKEHARLGLCLK